MRDFIWRAKRGMYHVRRWWTWKLARFAAHRGRRTYCICGQVERAVAALRRLR
jgi:hypothetical protein